MIEPDPTGMDRPLSSAQAAARVVNLDPAALLKLVQEHALYEAALRLYARPETYTDPKLAGDLTYVARVALGLTR